MTEISTGSGLSRNLRGIAKVKKHTLKVDMTPMVDLGFILITFFVMTVQLSKPMVVNLNMPKDGEPTTLGKSNALTVLLDDNRVYYYHGDWKDAYANNEVYSTHLSVANGLGKVIREKQHWLDTLGTKEGRKGLMLLIKGGNGASYQNIIDALDEALINMVEKYAVLSASPEEQTWMQNRM
jgi:biopolymer transport protein ExbD